MRRLPILLLLMVLLATALACTETGSLPTVPLEPAATSAWTVVYPILANSPLWATWGLDADDMWAVGNDGIILRYDGERCTRVESPTDLDITAIHGRARDDAWAITSSQILHWDGHRWRVARWDSTDHHYTAVWCDDRDDVFVGGKAAGVAAVLRHDGSRWRTTNLPRVEGQHARHIWRPAPGGPLLMSTNDRLFRYGNSNWAATATQLAIWDADGEIAIGRHPDHGYNLLYRFAADGEPYAPCPAGTLQFHGINASEVADSRAPLVSFANVAATLDDACQFSAQPAVLPASIYDFSIPELLRPTGNVVFAAGRQGLFSRGVWTDDQSISWQSLVPGPTEPIRDTITGTADLVFANSDLEKILVREHGNWRLETYAGIARGSQLSVLPDGKLVVWGTPYPAKIAVRQTDGTWSSLPDFPLFSRHLWTDGIDEAIVYNNGGIEWTLDGDHWARTDSVPGGIRHLSGRSGNEIYRLTNDEILERKHGDQWEHVLGDELDRVWGFHLSPWSDDIYVYLVGLNFARCTAILRHGALTVLTEGDEQRWESQKVCEARPGDFYQVKWDKLRRLTSNGWQTVPVDGATELLERVWGHPDQGLFILESGGKLHHRPFPETAD